MKLKVKELHVRVQVIMLKVLPIQAKKLNLNAVIFMPVTTPLQKGKSNKVLWK